MKLVERSQVVLSQMCSHSNANCALFKQQLANNEIVVLHGEQIPRIRNALHEFLLHQVLSFVLICLLGTLKKPLHTAWHIYIARWENERRLILHHLLILSLVEGQKADGVFCQAVWEVVKGGQTEWQTSWPWTEMMRDELFGEKTLLLFVLLKQIKLFLRVC